MKKITPFLLGLGLTLTILGGFLSSSPKNVGAATVVSLGKNGTSEYLLYPTDTLSAYTFIATSTTASSSFANGINLTGGCFAIGSVCLTTANIAESGNIYFTNPRVQTYLDTLSKGYFFSTTSADAWESTKSRWSTTSSDYWLTTKTFSSFSTTSADYWDSTKSRWSTTSNTYWLTQQTTDGLAQGSTNKYFANSLVDTWLGTKNLGVFWSTTSADAWHLTKTDVAFSTTSADYWISLYSKGFFFSSTSADYWLTTKSLTAASSTLYGDNGTFSGSNQFASLNWTNATGTRATTTSLAVTSVTSALHLANATGGVGAYGGTSCTNQFVRSLNGAGSATCATVANTDLANSAITINGTSVSLGGSITVASTTLLANNNTWGGTNTFTNAPIFSSLTGILKGNGAGALTVAANGTDYSLITANTCGSGHFSSVTAAGVFTCTADSGTGGSASQWATSTLFSNMIHTAGANGIGIGTSTPLGALTLASSSAVTQWWNHTNASANKRLGWMSWADGIFNFGTSTDAGATTSLLRLDGGTTTVNAYALTVGTGANPSSLISGIGTTTPSGGIDLTNGCYANSGVCLGTMALTGTQGQVEYFSAGNTAVGTSSLFIATSQNVGVGTTSPWAKLSVQGTSGQYNDIFSVASSSLQSLFNVSYNGFVGIGSSTPWGILSIIDSNVDKQPGIVMATSSGATVFWGATASTSDALGDPVRMLVGWGTKFLTNFDTFAQLSVNGEINTNNTIALECKAEGMKKTAQNTGDLTGSVISTTLGYPCGDFSYIEDAAGVADFVAGTTGNYIRLRTGAAGTIAAAGDGMGMALTTAGLYTATNTPLKLEVSARPVVNNATSTLYLLGFFNTTGVSANYAAMPTDGCGFVASTTQANWIIFCAKASAYTYLNSGIASTTNIATPSNGSFTRFRVEMGNTYATFRYLRGSVGDTNSWVTIGSISANYPNTAALNPTVAVGGVTAKLSDELQVRFIRSWYNDPEPY